jgi:hypothetical protein
MKISFFELPLIRLLSDYILYILSNRKNVIAMRMLGPRRRYVQYNQPQLPMVVFQVCPTKKLSPQAQYQANLHQQTST